MPRGRRFLLRWERGWTISQFQGATLHESTSLDFDDRGSGSHDACHTHWPRLSDCNQAKARKVIQDGCIEWGKARVAIDKNTFEKMLARICTSNLRIAG